jgi:broad specificity phosphatase PhoE
MDENVTVLRAVPWGAPALALLSHAKHLVPDAPAIVMVRHSERDDIREIKDIAAMPLNERGEQAALEFGGGLPPDRAYHFYHSPIARCRQTAEEILKGVKEQGGTVENITELKSLVSGYLVKDMFVRLLFRDGVPFIYNWLAGHYPPWVMEPSLNVAQRTAAEMWKLLQTAKASDTFVCVSHDHQVTMYLFHWAGILSTDSYIQYLDGFILQQVNGKLIVYHKNGKKELFSPYW